MSGQRALAVFGLLSPAVALGGSAATPSPVWRAAEGGGVAATRLPLVVNADGSSARRLTNNRLGEGSPAWQPVAPAQD